MYFTGISPIIRASELKVRSLLTFNSEALIIGEMPVKYIQLHGGHAIQVALQDVERNEVAADVDHQSAPGKARFVVNRNCRRGEAFGSSLYQLQKRLQPAHDSERRHCV